MVVSLITHAISQSFVAPAQEFFDDGVPLLV